MLKPRYDIISEKKLLGELKFEHIAVFSPSVYPSVITLLGQFAPYLGNAQVHWLLYEQDGTELPKYLQIPHRDLVVYVNEQTSNSGRSVTRKTDPSILEKYAFQAHTDHAQELMGHSVQQRNINNLHTHLVQDRDVCSFQRLCNLMRHISGQRVILQLQEVYVLLCAHYMHTASKYKEMVTASIWNGHEKRVRLHAEYFVSHLIRQSSMNVSQCLYSLGQRWPVGIPVTMFKALGQHLVNRGIASFMEGLQPQPPPQVCMARVVHVDHQRITSNHE